MTLIVACGLAREARIIAGKDRDVFTVAGGGHGERLERELDEIAALFSGVILSSGVAGALDPSLKPGDLVIDGDPALVERLHRILPGAIVGPVIGQDIILATREQKRVLNTFAGALAVDMESHVAARVASRRRRPFAVLRAISDGVDEALPPAALVGMRPDGKVALGAVLASLARRPHQLPALLRTARHAGHAFRALARAHDALHRAGFDGSYPAPSDEMLGLKDV